MKSNPVFILIALTWFNLSCKDESIKVDAGIIFVAPSFEEMANSQYRLGDTLEFTFYYEGHNPIKSIDVFLNRYESSENNGSGQLYQTIQFQTFYPEKRKKVSEEFTVSWVLGDENFPTPENYYDNINFVIASGGTRKFNIPIGQVRR